jgi:hypothetical protein
MQFLMLFNPDFTPFEPKVVERAFRSHPEFKNLRFEEPGGATIECDYIEPEDRTIIRLSGDASSISVGHTWGAALRAVLLIQKGLNLPLRVIDDDNTFDLALSEFSTVDELEAAMDKARTS